ncbi:hypothetical protein [Spirosoma rhododendri]|uniref:Uncharacterized protein n=1 Tax=Spirosoma rhododendri TaxID=2728024 RepID=A0A7L5DY62_9BACT|nr:hypothetical protein [Spirosoma rhododendri]QJD80917.1 hypothetical protein HH216_22705 [Spirosoma rhododendri]
MESEDKDDIIRAKQAISPNGLENQSVEGDSGVSSELPDEDLPTGDVANQALEDEYMNGDEPAENVPMTHQNRGMDKPDNGKGSYS